MPDPAASPPPGTLDDATASRLRLAILRLARRLRQESPPGITPSQLSALASIDHLGPVAIGDLAAHENVQPPTISRIVGTLEGDGWVERVADESDRSRGAGARHPEGPPGAGPDPPRPQRLPRPAPGHPRTRRGRDGPPRSCPAPVRTDPPGGRAVTRIEPGIRDTFSALAVRNVRPAVRRPGCVPSWGRGTNDGCPGRPAATS